LQHIEADYINFLNEEDSKIIHPHMKSLKCSNVEMLPISDFEILLKMLPNIESLEFGDRRMPGDIVNIQKLAAMPKLKRLKINFWQYEEELSEAALVALEKLNKRLASSEINFEY
jgi:hypothetical protein